MTPRRAAAWQSAAAAVAEEFAGGAGSLAERTEPVVLVPLNGGVAALDQALASGGTVVGYKVGAAASPDPAALRDRLHRAGRLDGAVIGARLGLAGELIVPVRRGAQGASLRSEPSAADSHVHDVTLSRSHAVQCHIVHDSVTRDTADPEPGARSPRRFDHGPSPSR